MVAEAFPLVKLASALFKQMAKPISNSFKRRAATSKIFRTWICMPPAQVYHWVDVHIGRRLMGMEAPTKVSRLSEAKAIELGTELIGEICIFAIASACLMAEYMRQNANDARKEELKNQQILSIENRLREVGTRLEMQSLQLRELTRMLADIAEKRKRPFPSSLLTAENMEDEVPHYGAPITDLSKDANFTQLPEILDSKAERNRNFVEAAMDAFEDSFDESEIDFGGD